MARRVSAALGADAAEARCMNKEVLTRVLLQMQMVASASCSEPAGQTTPAESRVRPTLRLLLDRRPRTTTQRRVSAGGASRYAITKCRWARARMRNRGEMAARNAAPGLPTGC